MKTKLKNLFILIYLLSVYYYFYLFLSKIINKLFIIIVCVSHSFKFNFRYNGQTTLINNKQTW